MILRSLSATSLFFLLTAAIAFGQDKATEKEWAKKLKELNPMDYKHLVEERDNLRKQSDECASTLKGQVEKKDLEIERLRTELDNVKKMGTDPDHHPSVANYKGPSHGILYKVQIGNFKNKDLSKYFENSNHFSGEVDEDGTKKYTLGSFSDYWEADRFKKYLREMGVKDAWIVSYKDGKRIPIKDALEGNI